MKKTCSICDKDFEVTSVYDGMIYGIRVCSSGCKEQAEAMVNTEESWSRKTDQDRKLYAKDMLQPFHNGKVNKDFVDVNGTEVYERNFEMSNDDVRDQL